MELYEYSACDLRNMLKNKKCSAEEITDSVYQRIDSTEGKIGAYLTMTKEQAMESARKTDEKISAGQETGALAGIPVGVKANLCTNGVKPTCASSIL